MIVPIVRKSPTRSQVRRISENLRRGLPVVLPTETQYALACDATSEQAIRAVRAIKGRLPTAPFSVFLPGFEALADWRIRCPNYGVVLARAFWPGPVTLILPTTNPIFKLLGGDGRSVGVRVTPEPIIAALLEELGSPLVATSANPSGVTMDAPSENRWLRSQAARGALVWAKPLRFECKPASTIIDCTGRSPRQLRPGPITEARWNAALSRSV